jgi:SAM-dependent methyltransferase
MAARIVNELAWQCRQHLRWSPVLRHKPGACGEAGVARLLGALAGAQRDRYSDLSRRYDLAPWAQCCTRREYIENLYVLDVLSRCIPACATPNGLEVGCRGFSYLPALRAFSPGAWVGVEIDAYARYWNGYTRRAYGDFIAGKYPGCRYVPGSLLSVAGSYQLIVWFLPFIYLDSLVLWGLPRRYFQPAALLKKAWTLLSPGGRLFIVNQGKDESIEQQKLCDELCIPMQVLGRIDSVFSPFKKTRFGLLAQRAASVPDVPRST